MGEIWFSSDLHFSHDREFVWKERGFKNVGEMNITLIDNFNSIIHPGDTLYLLGDNWLNCSVEEGIALLRQIRCEDIRFIRGNHDSPTRWEALKEVGMPIGWAEMIKYQGYHFYLSHYPTLTSNMDEGTPLKARVLNLYGHTHQNTNFYNENPLMYHVGMDSHNCYPISLDSIIEEIKEKTNECLSFL
jgi:calcineurin-like phosphoesterase family protein